MSRGPVSLATVMGLLAAGTITALTPLSAGTALAVDAPTITYPGDGDVVDQGQLTVRGVATGGDDAAATVMFVVDVSGSTSSSGFDCDGDGFINTADDLNGNGARGEILDCEIAGVIALNTQLAAIPGANERIRVGLVPFGSSSAVADVADDDGVQQLVSPVYDGGERDRTDDIVQAAASMTAGRIALFTQYSVGTGTSFSPALNAALDVLDGVEGPKFVFLLSDGFGSVTSSTLTRVASSGVEVRTFAVGTGSDRCAANGDLVRIASSGGSTCVYAPNPGTLTTAINTAPSTIDRVEVALDGGPPTTAAIDALGNFSADVFVSTGAHSVTVTVYGTDGTSASTTHTFTAGTGMRYVALGDSYSAGEGITPFRPVPGEDGGCHQSTKAYSTLIGAPGYEIPGINDDIDLDFVACSGAVLRDVLTVRQNARGEQHIVQLDAVDASADLITITIGGNDMGFSNIAAHCATQIYCFDDGFTFLNSGRSLSADEFVTVRLALLVPQLQSAYQTLRQRTNDQATVLVLDYPELFDDGILLRAGCKEAAIFDRSERTWLNDVAVELGLRIERAAGQSGVWTTSVIDDFRGHRVCDGGVNTQSEWLVGHETAANKKVTGDASFHPDDTGAEAYARVIAEFITEQVDAGVPLNPSGLPLNPGAVAAVASPRSFAPAARATVSAAEVGGDETIEGLSEAELAEIAAMTFGQLDVTGLSALRGDATCANLVAPGEQLVMTGYGFAPGAAVAATLRSATDLAVRDLPGGVVADATGVVRASFLVPTDFVEHYSGQITTTFALDLFGPNDAGGEHRASTFLYVDTADGECTQYINAAGDVAVGGVAPSAASTPGIPDGTPLVVETFEQAVMYRARNGDPSRGEQARRIYVERDVEKAFTELGLVDVDPDGDGWSLVGRTNGAADSGEIARFWIGDDGIPYVATRHQQRGCLTLTPARLDEVRTGQTRLMDQQPDTSDCRGEAVDADVDRDGTPDDIQPLYRLRDDGRRIYIDRSIDAAEAQLGVSDWDPDGDRFSAYSQTNGAGEYGTVIDLVVDDAGIPTLRVEHPSKGCLVLRPNRIDTVGVGHTRRMIVVETIGGACSPPVGDGT